jgi:hypothetical protein
MRSYPNVIANRNVLEDDHTGANEASLADVYVVAFERDLVIRAIGVKACPPAVEEAVVSGQDLASMRERGVVTDVNMSRDNIEQRIHRRTSLSDVQTLLCTMHIRVVDIRKATPKPDAHQRSLGDSAQPSPTRTCPLFLSRSIQNESHGVTLSNR